MLYHLKKLFRQKVKLIVRHEYFLGAQDMARSFNIDPDRFRKIRNELISNKLAQFREFISPPKILNEQLKLVHTDLYIQKLMDPVTVGQELGIPSVLPWDDHLIDYFKSITGGTVFGLKQALQEPGKPVFNLGGGFHHAHAEKAEGFCLINDTVIAIRCIRKKYPKLKILIIDLDYHQGNGNLILLKDDPLSYTFSMHALNWAEVEKPENTEILLPDKCNDSQYMKPLKEKLPGIMDTFIPDAVIYLAGADPYSKDTLCDFQLTEPGMLDRDMYVFQETSMRELPLLILAAGGYGDESWKPYYNFIRQIILKNSPIQVT